MPFASGLETEGTRSPEPEDQDALLTPTRWGMALLSTSVRCPGRAEVSSSTTRRWWDEGESVDVRTIENVLDARLSGELSSRSWSQASRIVGVFNTARSLGRLDYVRLAQRAVDEGRWTRRDRINLEHFGLTVPPETRIPEGFFERIRRWVEELRDRSWHSWSSSSPKYTWDMGARGLVPAGPAKRGILLPDLGFAGKSATRGRAAGFV